MDDQQVNGNTCLGWVLLFGAAASAAYSSGRVSLPWSIALGVLGPVAGLVVIPVVHALADDLADGPIGRGIGWGLLNAIPVAAFSYWTFGPQWALPAAGGVFVITVLGFAIIGLIMD